MDSTKVLTPGAKHIINLAEVRAFAFMVHAYTPARKYTNEPYIVHPLAVAGLVASVPGATPEMIAAALLHDTVEDSRNCLGGSPVTLEHLEARFGATVAGYVRDLSDLSTPEDGNRAARKAAECDRLAGACAEVQTIKYADLISNTISIVQFDPKFAKVYLEEKVLLLNAMDKGDPGLRELAWTYARNGRQALHITG